MLTSSNYYYDMCNYEHCQKGSLYHTNYTLTNKTIIMTFVKILLLKFQYDHFFPVLGNKTHLWVE